MEKISVVGVGRMGICFALALEHAGYDVLGLDVVEDYVEKINCKDIESPEKNVNEYLEASQNFRATTDLKEAVDFSDTLFVMLRTGNLPSGQYDHCFVDKFISDLISLGKVETKKDLVICSNVTPGYCDEIQEKLLGLNYIVSFNPEWIAQGRIIHDFENPDILVIGEANKHSGNKIEKIHKTISDNPDLPVYKMNRLSGEIVKIGLNSFLTVKITYANMIGDMAIRSGVSPEPILKAIGGDSRIGKKYINYGFGYGGPCFPRNTKVLSYYGDFLGVGSEIINSVMSYNNKHTDFQVEEFLRGTDKSEKIIINNVTYKEGTTIIEESQQLLFAVKIAEKGYCVVIEECPSVIKQVRDIYGYLFEYREKRNS